MERILSIKKKISNQKYLRDFDFSDLSEAERLKRMQQGIWDFFCENIEKYGFSIREGQQDMALDIGEAIANQQHLIVEAGVGIGKSFAYVVPLLLFHKQFRRPLIVSTSTITLQEQISEDIKRTSEILKYPIQVVVGKGQTHYICQKRIDELNDVPMKILLQNDINNRCFERKDFSCNFTNEQWDQICIVNYGKKNCRNCGYYEKCHFTILRKAMHKSNQIVICNHDLLTVHLKKMQRAAGLLPEMAPIIVVDEAHNLEEKVRSSLTCKYSKYKILNTTEIAANTVNKLGTDIDRNIIMLTEMLSSLFDVINNQVIQQIKDDVDAIDTGRFFFNKTSAISRLINEVANILCFINENVQIHSSNNLSELQEIAIDYLGEISNDFYILDDTDSNIVWIEKSSARIESIELCLCPRELSKEISNLFFCGNHISLLTSATLTNQRTGSCEDKYRYITANLGFPISSSDGNIVQGYLAEPKPSPFLYDEHAMIYYTDDLPHPIKQRDSFIIEGSKRIIELLKLSDGHALILFTAKSDMNAVYMYLTEENLPYKILKENPGSSQESVLSGFRAERTSVLLGTGAYWEGINIVGESLTNVIIFRLPFPVPDPIIKSKCAHAKNPLLDVLAPEMIIKLNQGVGRLIRSEHDVGIISIIDSRLADENVAPYKDIVWDSLPIKNKTSDLSVLKNFYRGIIHQG